MDIKKYKIFACVYTAIGIIMFLFPPKYHYRSYESKFGFFMSIDRVDFYFYIYEILSYILIGSVIYLLFFKNKKEHNQAQKDNTDKISIEGKNNLIKEKSVQMINEAVNGLHEITKCEDIIKTKIVILTIYLRLISGLKPTSQEEKIMQDIINIVLEHDDELFSECMRYVNIYAQNHKEIVNSDKDNSQKLFALANIHAMYLFRDKKDHELLAETTIITSYYDLILKVAKLIKYK